MFFLSKLYCYSLLLIQKNHPLLEHTQIGLGGPERANINGQRYYIKMSAERLWQNNVSSFVLFFLDLPILYQSIYKKLQNIPNISKHVEYAGCQFTHIEQSCQNITYKYRNSLAIQICNILRIS